MSPELARRGWEYFTANRICHPNAQINIEGLKLTMQIHGDQTKEPPPDPLRYIDQSFCARRSKNWNDWRDNPTEGRDEWRRT